MYAQDPFVASATGISVSGMTAVRALGILFIAGGGIGMLADEHHAVKTKLLGMGIGGVVTYLAAPISSYLQNMHG